MKKIIGIAAVVLISGLLLIQLLPFGKDYSNPPVVQEPHWDSPDTRALAMRACGDCHSNETVWPFYSKIAPVSWLVARDVAEGREKLNFSEMNRDQEADEAAATVHEGEMPPRYYTPLHPSAQLNPAEKAALIAGLQATFGGELTRERERRGDDD